MKFWSFRSVPAVLAMAATLSVLSPAAVQAQTAASEMTSGEIRKVDKEASKLTIKHGEIKNLAMPPMTMVFGVKSPDLLERLKVGDKILFKAVDDKGKYIVTELQASP